MKSIKARKPSARNLLRHALLCCACVVASGAVATRARADDVLEVVASLPDLGAIASAVGGDRVKLTTIAAGVQDPHFVDPKPSYVVKLRDADVLLVNGLDLEVGWIPPLIDSARNPRIQRGQAGYVDCSANIPVIDVPSGAITRAEGDVHPYGNPHYTTDPLNAKIVADTLAAAFTRARPKDAAYFEQHKRAFQDAVDKSLFGAELVDLVGGKKLDRLARSGELLPFLATQKDNGASLEQKLGGLFKQLAPLRDKPVVFFHKSYSYFAARFGLRAADYIEQKPGIQPGPSHLAEVVARIRHEQIKLVITHPFYDAKIARLVADKGGARLVAVPLQVGGVSGASDYLKTFDVVASLLLGTRS